MANEAAALVNAYMETKNVPCQFLDDEHNSLRIGWKLNNTSISIYMFFNENNNDVHIEGHEFIAVPDDKMEKMYKICNDINGEFRWIKFRYSDKYKEIIAEDDAIIQLDSCGEEVFRLMCNMAGIVDEAYPEFMKAMWA